MAAAHRCLSRASAKMTVGSTFSLKHGATGASRSVFGEMGMRVQPSQFALQKTQIPVDFSRLFGGDAVPRRLYSTTPTPVAESSTKAEGSKAHQTHEEAKENGKEHKHKRQSFGPSSIEPFVSNISKVIMVNRKLFKWFLILSGVSISGMFYILYNYPQVRDAICFGVQGSIRFLSCLTTVIPLFLFISSPPSSSSFSFSSSSPFFLLSPHLDPNSSSKKKKKREQRSRSITSGHCVA